MKLKQIFNLKLKGIFNLKLKGIFKEKVTRKLAIYSLVTLIIFSMIVAIVFVIFLEKYVVNNEYVENNQKKIIVKRAKNIAENIYIDEYKRVYFNHMLLEADEYYNELYSDYLFDDLFENSNLREMYVWLIDRDRKLLFTDSGFMDDFNYYEDLTKTERDIINSAFQGKEVVINSSSHFTNEILITAGVPVYNLRASRSRPAYEVGKSNYAYEGYVNPEGVLLVQSIIKPSEKAFVDGFVFVLWSLVIAFIFSYILLILFAHRFTRSLYKMRDNAFELSKGNYDVKNNIFQNDEIGYLANTLDFLSVKLKEADEQTKNLEKMRSDFISNISHELRTPATVMVGSLEALVDGVVKNDEDIREYHINMLNEAKFLSRLIGDLLEISRLQNVDFVIEKSELFILDVINDVVRSLRQIASKKNISIDLHKNEFKDGIYGDYGRLKQMFTIILDNAIKFSHENSKVEIILNDNQIRIKDYGTGIKKEDLPRVFDRFYKERSEKNKVGTGLGLSIAKSIATRHDIKLNVESVFGEYTEFIFEY